ncbi:type II secretion system protein GspD [Endozoicomonas acroporae]|uniref:type II secretion system protein GspD n=1 Tax=Endozoicomonas acroporae TaxID=1701104 RepID=UPI003D7A5A6A
MFRSFVKGATLVALSLPALAADNQITITNGSLSSFVDWTASHLHKNIVVGAPLGDLPLTLYARYQDQRQLETLLEDTVVSSGLFFSSNDSTIKISLNQAIDFSELQTVTVPLQHIQSDFAYQALQEVLTSSDTKNSAPSSTVRPSPTTNALIITATYPQIRILRDVIREIDKPRQQVVISAVIAEITDKDYQSLGINLSSVNEAGLDFGFTGVPKSSPIGLDIRLFSHGDLLAFLEAVQTNTKNELLSAPSLLTLNRQPASIVVGQNVPFITGQSTGESSSTENPFQTITREDVGLTLEVLPIITPSGAVELKVGQTVDSVSKDQTASDIITNTRKINTTITVQDGQTVFLGGLRTVESVEGSTGVPILSDIPLLGKLFSSRTTEKKALNLVVAIRASIYQVNDRRLSDVSVLDAQRFDTESADKTTL